MLTLQVAIMIQEPKKYHHFLDEAGDTTFFGKGRLPMLGKDGVSQYFSLGLCWFNEPLQPIRKKIIALVLILSAVAILVMAGFLFFQLQSFLKIKVVKPPLEKSKSVATRDHNRAHQDHASGSSENLYNH